MNALDPARIVLAEFTILNVRAIRRLPKIEPTIIASVRIFVVNDVDRIGSRLDLPNDPMSKVINLVDPDHDVTFASDRSGNSPAAFVVVADV